MSRLSLDDLSPRHRAEALAQMERLTPIPAPQSPPVTAAAPAKRIRQHQGDGMNKWERDYKMRLHVIGWQHIYREVSLPLANGLRYKVDFLAVSPPNELTGLRTIEGHEVKGFARSTGIAKVKMAARLYPWITFRLVTKQRKKQGGGWSIEEVLP